MSKRKVFSGERSRKFWEAVHKAERTAGVTAGVLYEYGCLGQELEDEIKQLRSDLGKQRRTIIKLRAALKPFADVAKEIPAEHEGRYCWNGRLTVAQYRRAEAAVAAGGQDGE